MRYSKIILHKAEAGAGQLWFNGVQMTSVWFNGVQMTSVWFNGVQIL